MVLYLHPSPYSPCFLPRVPEPHGRSRSCPDPAARQRWSSSSAARISHSRWSRPPRRSSPDTGTLLSKRPESLASRGNTPRWLLRRLWPREGSLSRWHTSGTLLRTSSARWPVFGRTLAHWWRLNEFNSPRLTDLVRGVIRWIRAIRDEVKEKQSTEKLSFIKTIPCVIQIQCLQMTPQKLSLQKLHKTTTPKMNLSHNKRYSNLQDWIISSSDTVMKMFMFPSGS